MGFPRKEHWSGLPFPTPGGLPNPGIEPGFPTLQADSPPSEPSGKPRYLPKCYITRDAHVWNHTGYFLSLRTHVGSGGSDSKESTCQRGRLEFDAWAGEIPSRRKWQPTPVFLPGMSQGQRCLVGYSPWGHKESDTTEQLNNRTHAPGSTPWCRSLGCSWGLVFLL